MQQSSRFLVRCGWDHVPHLTDKAKADLLKETPPHLRDARSKGLPSLGSGAIYPVPLSDILEDPMPMPAHWPRAYALDVGWNRTAALWGAWDDGTGTLHVYSEYYRGQAEPVVHATAIKSRGDWMRGVIDPASAGSNQVDGRNLFEIYKGHGLKLHKANNAVETGILEVWTLLSEGRIRISRACRNFETEYRIYRRDEKGRIVKEKDHLMDCLRYLVMSGRKIAGVQRAEGAPQQVTTYDQRTGY